MQNKKHNLIIALLLGSALFVLACKGNSESSADDEGAKPVMVTDNHSMRVYEAGRKGYTMKADHIVRYEGKDTIYTIFDEGIYIETYDSVGAVSTWLKAKYAINYESVNLWEARDSVVGQDKDGKTIYTDLLFWDQKAKRIYSNIKTRVVDGEESIIGFEGFESDEDLSNIEFYDTRGRILVDTTKVVSEPDTLKN